MKNCDLAIIGSGFVGSALAEFVCNKYSVLTISKNPQPEWLKKYDIPHKICDIRNFQNLSESLENPKIVLHTVALSMPQTNSKKEESFDVSVNGTQNVCKIVFNT